MNPSSIGGAAPGVGSAGGAAAMGAVAAAYDPFARYATREEDAPMLQASSTAHVHSYAPAAPAGDTFALFDESALGWVTRDSGHTHAPNALKHVQASVKLWEIMPCVDASGGGGGGGASAFAGVASTRPAAFVAPVLHVGEVLELYGRTGCGKTECMYQAVMHAILPKTLTCPDLGCSLSLNGLDGGVVYLDFDSRFSLPRLDALVRSRVARAARQALRAAEAYATFVAERAHFEQEEREAQWAAHCEEAIVRLFASPLYASFRAHYLASLFLVHAQTPRQALVALCEVETLLQEYGQKTHTWREKERRAEEKQRRTNGGAVNKAARRVVTIDGDVEMKTDDADDFLYDMSLDSSSFDSAKAGPPPRMIFLLVDNAAAFHWQCKGQPIGHASIASGLHSKERAAVGAGALADLPPGGAAKTTEKSPNWFIELFSYRLRYLLHQYHLIGIVSKPTISQSGNVDALALRHDEILGLTWNALVTCRIVMCEEREAQETSAMATRRFVRGSREEAEQRQLLASRARRGALRRASIKFIKPTPAGATGVQAHNANEWMFAFRIGSEGVQPETTTAPQMH